MSGVSQLRGETRWRRRSTGAAARVAAMLRSGDIHLATKIGEPVDHLADDVTLGAEDQAKILRVLDDCPDDLVALRVALLEESLWQSSSDGISKPMPRESFCLFTSA